MKSNNINIIKSKTFKTVAIVTLLIFSFDFLTKVLLVNQIEGFTRYSAIPKLILETGLIYYLIKNKKDDFRGVIYGLLLIGIAGISILVSNEELTSQFLFQKIYNLNKFIYIFLFAETLFVLKKEKRKKIVQHIRNIIILIGAVNGLFMILGWLTDFQILQAYRYTSRFGYNGFFVKTSETSYLYILLIITTYYEYIHKKTKGWLCIFFIAVSLLIGTKAVWLFLLLLGIIHFAFHKKKIIKIISRTSMILGSILAVIFHEYIIKLIINSFAHGPSLYAEYGFITVITSTRDLLLQNAIEHIQKGWTLTNYLFGGINLLEYGVEFEFIDIFLFFGIIGLIIYLLFIKRIFFTTFFGKHKILLFTALMLVAAFAGNFFMSIISSIFAYTVFQNMEYLSEENTL